MNFDEWTQYYVRELSPKIGSPADCIEVMKPHIKEYLKEHFIAAYLNTKNKVIKVEVISIGTLNANIVHPREVFRPAIVEGAAAIIVCHNHPSGDPTPSKEDIEITKKLVESGKIIGIELLDHVVMGASGNGNACYVSMKQEGFI